MDPNHDQTTSFSESQKQTHEESNPQSQIDSNDTDALLIINKNSDLSVEVLTDELINSTYESIAYNYSVLFLPKYLDTLSKHMEEMPSISQKESTRFLTNLLLCILPIFSINNDAGADPISFSKSMSSILVIYLKLHSKLGSNVGSLSMIKWSQVYPTKLQQLEQFLKTCSNSIVIIASCEAGTSLEVVLSEMILSFVKTLQAATSNQMMDNLIDLRIEIKNLAEILSQFVLKISCQIKCKKYVPLEITKKIAFNAFAATLSIFRSEKLKSEYWKLSNEQAGEPFHLEFFMRFLLSTCKIENDQIYKDGDLFSYASCYHNEEKEHGESDLEIKFETNIEIDNQSYFLSFLDKMEQMIIDFISELPERKAIERLTSFIVPYIEGITRRDNSKAFIQVVSTRNKARFYQMLKNLLNIVDSQENYKTILRVVFNRLPKTYLSSPDNKEEIAFLWDAIQEISRTRAECMRSLAAVQFENLKNVINETDPGDTQKAIFTPEESFDKIINLFEFIQEVYDTESLGTRGEGFDIAESVLNFIRHSHPTALLKYKAQVKQIIDAICKSQFLVYQLVLAEDKVEKIIHECFTHEKTQIFLHFMKRFFQKMKFNEENMDAELRKRVFLCLRRYCTSINTLFNKDDPADCLMAKKIFSFIVRFYIVLIEEEKISNFEDFFNLGLELSHNDSIFHTTRSNDSQMILLAFIQFYDAMLDAGKYEILLDKDVAKVLLKLTSTLLLVSPKLNSVLLERGCYDKLYYILSEAHLRVEFNNEDILAIINILFNLATKGYYHFVVEKPLSFDIARSVEDQMNKIIFSDYSPFWNYIAIKNRYFLSLLLKCLFEWNAAKNVKKFYLAVLESALTNSLANAAVCLQGEVFDRLMLYMKIELDKDNKKRLQDLIYSVLRVGVAVSHVKAFMRAFRYNYWESHEDYFRSLVSEFARAKFIKRMSDPDNYYHSFLSSLYILKKVLQNSEDNENFTNFNGDHSGIIISNLNQSLRSTLTFLFTFRVENYISSDKRNMVSNYKILRDKITFEDNFNRNSFFTNMESSLHVNYNYFDNSKNGLLLESRIGKMTRSSIMENNELYYPRLFSVVASHATLEFYVGIQNRQPCLILDGKHRKKDGTLKEYREYFDFCPKENEWYTIFLMFTSKSTFKAYIANDKSDEPLKPINRSSNNTFSHLMDHFGSVRHFCIGTSPAKSTTKLKDFQSSEECNLSVENSFCGQIKRFYLIKKELSDADMENILKKIKTRCNNSDQLQDSTIKTKKRRSLLFGNKPDEAMDLEQFESQALLNLNAFPNLDEIGAEEDDQWASLSKNDAKVTHSIVSIQDNIEKMKKAKAGVDRSGDMKHEIRAKGVTHLEKSCFEDVLFRIGNAEIILYILEILNKFEDDSWQSEQRHKLLCEVIRLLSVVMCTTSNKDDVMIFFSEKNGFHFLAHLIKQYVVKFGVSECVIDTLHEFITNICKPEDRYKGFMALILNFDTWNKCSLATQSMVYEKADLIISKDQEIYSHFKKNYDFMTLIIQFQKLIKSESFYIPSLQKGFFPYRTVAESIEDGNDGTGKKKLEELQMFREKIQGTVIKVLSTPLDVHLSTKEQKDKLESDQITEKECEHIVSYIASSQPSPFVLEIFKIILKLLTLENKNMTEAIKEGLQKHELKDVIFSILYTAYRRNDSPNRRRRATSIERVLDNEGIDSLIFHCIEISRLLFFSNRLDTSSGKAAQKLDNDSLHKANLLLADFLFGADICLPNEKDEALKVVQSEYLQLYNLCLNDMDPLTYKGLFKTLMQSKQNGKSEKIVVFRKDEKMIGLVLEKFIQKRIRPAEGKTFLKDLYTIMRTHYSMKVFLEVPNYLHFLNELLQIQIDEKNADEEIRGLIYKIFRRFISFTLFEEELRVFCLISLIEFMLNEKLKDSKPLKEEDQLIIHEQRIPNNLYQLFKHIEAAICEFKEQIFKGQAQGENTNETSLSEKSLEAIHSKKAFILNFTQFIYYYEYFLIKNHKKLVEQENLICQFTTTLFEFMYDTQILLVTYPSLKHVSGDISSNMLSKRHENICYRNGGPFLSILTSIFTVLKNTKTADKIELLKCCFTILALLRSKKSLEGDLKGLSSTSANSKHEVQKDKSSQHSDTNTKKESVLTVRQAMTPSLIEVQSNEKSPDLLVYKDMLLVYETMFCEILKLMTGEIKRLLRINRESIEGDDKKIDVMRILTRQESKSTSSSEVCLELSKLLMEILAVNGAAIKKAIQQYYQISDLNPNKLGSPVKKSLSAGTQKTPQQTELRVSNQITPIRMEFEGQGEESNDKIMKKQISSLVERVQTNPGQTSLKVNELIGICQSLFDFDMDHPSVNNRQPKLQGSEDLMQKILIFVECHHKDLKKEVISTLKNSHLRTIYLIKELNCSYFKLQTDKTLQLIKKSYDEFQADLDPEKSIKFFKEKDANRQQLVNQNKNLVIENFKKNEHLILRVKSLWLKTKRGLTEERGVWQMETKHSALTRYKYGKIEDELHRRMRLIVDKQAAKIVYKSKEVYEKEKLDGKKIYDIDMKETSISDRESMQSGPTHQSFIRSPLLSREQSNFTQQSIRESNNDVTRLQKKAVTMKPESSKNVQFLEEISGSEGEELSVSGSEDEEVKSEQTASKLKKKNASNKIYKCERITLKGAIWGELQITENYFIFSPLPEYRPETEPYEFGAIKDNRIMSTKKKNWNLSRIKRIYHRRYMFVKSAFEFFTSENKSYYFNVFNPNDLKTILTTMKSRARDVQIYSGESFDNKLTARWQEGKMSNFEYLMHLNMLAGRSFNDLTQYPVFPWILADYTSEELNLNTKDEKEQKRVFRDLSLPMGALNEEKRRELKTKLLDLTDIDSDNFESVDKEELEKKLKTLLADESVFMYGSHYSAGGHVLGYLVRLEPFTSLQIKLQSGKLEEANRTFASIPKAWDMYFSSHNRQNFKELTPEFFYCPNFLKNKNKIDFGMEIGTVELPAWAKTPEEFIQKHREALECDYVSRNLDRWIDLIFGYKQYGVEAFHAYNVFDGTTYEQWFTKREKKFQILHLCQVSEFGQCPIQLFKTKHAERASREASFVAISRVTSSDLHQSESEMRQSEYAMKIEKGLTVAHLHTFEDNPIMWVHLDKKSLKVIFRNRDYCDIPCEGGSLAIKPFQWAKKKERLGCANLGKIIFNDFNISNQVAAFGGTNFDSSYLVVAGYQDNSFKIVNRQIGINLETINQSIHFHKKLVTCIACAENDKAILVIAGSKDCRISIWSFEVRHQKLLTNPKPKQIIYGHHCEVICLAIESSLGIFVSADKEGVVIIHCLISEKILYTCYPKLEQDEEIKSILIDDNGIIALLTVTFDHKYNNRILVYNINGDYICEHKIDFLLGIRYATFIDKSKSTILMSTKEGQLMTLNVLVNRAPKPLTPGPSEYRDLSEDLEDSKKMTNKVENKLKNNSINHFYFDREFGSLICGYEIGSLTVVNPRIHTNKLQTLVDKLNDTGL